jgi:hypothetical protein
MDFLGALLRLAILALWGLAGYGLYRLIQRGRGRR